MNESKIEATDRLRREGRWSEASKFKDASVKRLRAEGKTKAEANDIAWAEMIAAFPPLPAIAKPEATDPLDITSADTDLIDRLATVPVDWERDVLWVYSRLEHPRIRLEDAPSLGAWGLLRSAREDRQKFFGQVVGSVIRASKATTTENGEDDNQYPQDPGLADLERMIAG